LAFFAFHLRSTLHQKLPVKIGLIKERKNPPDKRVAFIPDQCSLIQSKYPQIQFYIERSEIRSISDEMYAGSGLKVGAEIQDCDLFFGIKEVPPEYLIPGKTYFFFSHTIKKQAHNQRLLRMALEKKITLVDYECLVDGTGERTVAFGRFAGNVGAYNALRMWMFRFHQVRLKAAFECGDFDEMINYAKHHISGLIPIKIAVTGSGRVGKGAVEVLRQLGIEEVNKQDFLANSFDAPVFTILSSKDYFKSKQGVLWDEQKFRKEPEGFESQFMTFAQCTDVLITCHYWDPRAPTLFKTHETKRPDFKIKIISDVTCDLNGSIPTTLRISTIANPFYDINPETFEEKVAFSSIENITVCSVDNLPCELPYDASKAFGEMLIKNVIPELATGSLQSIENATICRNGELTPQFKYLEEFASAII